MFFKFLDISNQKLLTNLVNISLKQVKLGNIDERLIAFWNLAVGRTLIKKEKASLEWCFNH